MTDAVKRLKARFSILENTSDFVLIRDNCNKFDTMSVTNDAEAVVEVLHDMGVIHKKTLYYIDSTGRVDILLHDGTGSFEDFMAGYSDEASFYKDKFGVII